MQKSLQHKILTTVLALGSAIVLAPHSVWADGDGWYLQNNIINVNKDNTVIDLDDSVNYTNIYGNGHKFTVNGGHIDIVYGNKYDATTPVEDCNITINSSYFKAFGSSGFIYGAYSTNDTIHNTITINNATFNTMSNYTIYGGCSTIGNADKNSVIINNTQNMSGTIYGGKSYEANATGNNVTINGSSTQSIYGGHSELNATENIITINDSIANYICGGYSYNSTAIDNKIIINNGTINDYVRGGSSSNGTANRNTVIINNGVINNIQGGETSSGVANNNKVIINGGTVTGIVYGGYADANESEASYNNISIRGSANIKNATLYGGDGAKHTGNTLTIDGWSGSTKSIHNFDGIEFKNITLKTDGTVLELTDTNTKSDLSNTKISISNIAGGQNIKKNDKYTLISGIDNYNGNAINTTAGVAANVSGLAAKNESGNVVFTVNEVSINGQTALLSQTYAAAAAFVNQGSDLISDSLDTLSRDGKYGVKTFAAVHGNRSKYDVADDIKINGWSTIVGVGAENAHAGGDFSWGVFYENGSGNYRTFNEFNNEFFRGDGSMVYNGGGIAARYENAHSVYTEGSLRAGMLKNEIDNALRDGSGQNYGADMESSYYGAHIGIGQIIPLSESSDLDIYGKFFHTYTEGDNFTIAGDKFDLDSITSDRLRLGARITANKENKFSTYYGLAYEYEFNGDADMTAAGINAPTESLQGSSYMAELGLNYQPTPDSPWSFDLNLRGYTGERQGGSFNVQATFTF